jgi:hypothetical protein
VSGTFTVLQVSQAFAAKLLFYVIVDLRVEVSVKDANTRPGYTSEPIKEVMNMVRHVGVLVKLE